MAQRKKAENTLPKEKITENLNSNSNPLVFISHDTRDAELAEEFSNLLKSASAGALKSFRSSDKKGTQGIEYGQEWYPAIMDKIDEASDIVCLLTQHSVDRPWILYEAGVAKGKLDKKVIGVALGIPLSSAISGPFAQFQNNDGDVDSITKLVLELVRKVPGLDPDSDLVKQLVENFIQKANNITEKIKEQNTDNKANGTDENSVAKLFEEVKIMFDSLPAKIEDRIDPEYKKRRRRFHPFMLEDILHSRMGEESNLGFLVALSLYKEEFPWFYEIGIETYRGLKSAKTLKEKEKIFTDFDRAMNLLDHPMMREFHDNSKHIYFLIKEGRHTIFKFLERFLIENKEKQ